MKLHHKKKCKVCASSHRREYERLRIEEKLSYDKLEEVAKEHGEHISYNSFRGHFKNKHTDRPIDYYDVDKPEETAKQWLAHHVYIGDSEEEEQWKDLFGRRVYKKKYHVA